MLDVLYRGESRRRTIRIEGDGVAIPHASIADVRVILVDKNTKTILAKYSKVVTAGYVQLTQEAAAGEYSFDITTTQSVLFPVGTMLIEVYRKYTSPSISGGYVRITEKPFYDVKESVSGHG